MIVVTPASATCACHHALQVFDYRNDVILAETCREDVNKFCKKVKKGMPQIFALCAKLWHEPRLQPLAHASGHHLGGQSVIVVVSSIYCIIYVTGSRASMRVCPFLQARGGCTSACGSTRRTCRQTAARRSCTSPSCRRR